jgi:hypothetical protein
MKLERFDDSTSYCQNSSSDESQARGRKATLTRVRENPDHSSISSCSSSEKKPRVKSSGRRSSLQSGESRSRVGSVTRTNRTPTSGNGMTLQFERVSRSGPRYS